MDAVKLLVEEARRDGVRLSTVDGDLEIEAKPEQRHWLEKLRPHKPEILRILNGESAEPSDDELHDAPWPAIESFDSRSLPPFPSDALPPVLRDWVAAESLATQTPADLAGLLAMAVCSATIARRVVVQPRPGWIEPSNLYAAVLLEPGSRKSAVFADATKPLLEIECELIQAAGPTVAREQSARRQSELLLKQLEKRAAEKGDSEAKHEAIELAAVMATEVEPVMPQLIVDDATAEKLGIILEQQGGRIASMSAEGGVFDLMAGLYSKNGMPNFDVYLKGHSGDDLNTDRVSRRSVRVPRPAITGAYTMQPQVIKGLAGNPVFRGRGLLARFLYAAPPSWIGQRQIAPPPVPDSVREEYRRVVRRIAASFGNIESGSGELKIKLAGDAEASFRSWEFEIEQMLADGGEMERIRDWGAKLAGATLRIAAVLHCVQHDPAGTINLATIEAAIIIGRYLIPHAQAVLTMMQFDEVSVDDDAQYVLRWIQRHGKRAFPKRDAHQHGRNRFRRADDIDPALKELVRRGYIRLRQLDRIGPGRPSPTYEVNPAILEIQKPENRSQYSQNPSRSSKNGNSENIEDAVEQSQNEDREQMTI